MRKRFKVLLMAVMIMAVSVLSVGVAFCEDHVPTSLLDTGAMEYVGNFAADLTPTVTGILAIIIPAGLGLWALAFGIRKGLAYLKRIASRSV